MTTTTTRPCWHCGTRHESDTMPALCSAVCIAAWQQRYAVQYAELSPVLAELATKAQEVREAAGQTLTNLAQQFEAAGREPRHTNEPCRVEAFVELQPSTLAAHDQAVLDTWCTDYPSSRPFINALSIESQRELAQQLRPVTLPGGLAAARTRLLDLHQAGHLGYIAPSDEWVDHHGEPLIPQLQHVADRLARDGELPEFFQFFDPKWSAPAPPEDNRDFPDEARPADEPQDLVGAEQAAAAQLLPHGMPERAELLGERPFADAPEPAFLARLLNALRRWKP